MVTDRHVQVLRRQPYLYKHYPMACAWSQPWRNAIFTWTTNICALMSPPPGSGSTSPPLSPSLADALGILDNYAAVMYLNSQLFFNSWKGLSDYIIFNASCIFSWATRFYLVDHFVDWDVQVVLLYDHVITVDFEVRLAAPCYVIFFVDKTREKRSQGFGRQSSHAICPTWKLIHSFRLSWRLPKVLFLINRYVVPPMLMFVASLDIAHSELTHNCYRYSFNEISE